MFRKRLRRRRQIEKAIVGSAWMSSNIVRRRSRRPGYADQALKKIKDARNEGRTGSEV
jgi:hypothetical protein